MDAFSFKDARDLLLLLNTIGLAVLSFVTWLRKPGVDAGAAVKKLGEDQAKEHTEHRTRLTVLEERTKHMPTSEELAMLEGTVKAINERTEGQSEAIETIRKTLGRIEDYLLNRK